MTRRRVNERVIAHWIWRPGCPVPVSTRWLQALCSYASGDHPGSSPAMTGRPARLQSEKEPG